MDVLTKKQRSFNMSRIRGKNTGIEISFRSYVWNKGIRGYRLNYKIAGRPDLYFPTKKVAVFIDGCFWHRCPICFVKPKTNIRFWNKKVSTNEKRDKSVNKLLRTKGIHVVRLWEHQVKKDIEKSYNKLVKLL